MPLFGEIIEPSSRALFCDDSSEDEQNSEELPRRERHWELQWFSQNALPITLENVIVLQGHLASDFFHICVKESNEKVGEVKEVPFSEDRHAHYRQKKPLGIYKLSSSIFACLCPEVDYDDCNIILEAILPLLNISKKVTSVVSTPAPQFKCSDASLDLPPSFMRALYSSSFNGQELIAPILEHPNIVSGIAAAVLSWCEVFAVPGCLYVCYSDSEDVDSISAEPLVQVFSKHFKSILNVDKLIAKGRVLDSSNNLYM